ncbi:MAG: M28 family peptidase [Algicola sp.]|nr:M28 family peptidase [Algicola sp.]
MQKKLPRSLLRITATLFIFILCAWLAVSRPSWFEYSDNTTSAKQPSPLVNPATLKEHVRKLSIDFHPRDFRHPENLNAAADYIKSALRFNNSRVSLQTYRVGKHDYHNVIAVFGPEEGELTVIGAHYDAYSTLPGADDNASGVAGLLELGRLLSQNPPKHRSQQRVMLIAYTLEEPPMYATEFMGSMQHAVSLKDQNIEVKTMISLEMIGFYSDEPNSQSFPMPLLNAFYPLTGNYIAVVGNMTSNTARNLRITINQNTAVDAYSISAPSFITGVDFSDHRSYWHFDYDAVMVTDTAFFRNRAYHTAGDTFERLNYDKMAAVVSGVYAFLK